MYLLLFAAGLAVGILIGIIRWRGAVIRLNELLADKDKIIGTQQSGKQFKTEAEADEASNLPNFDYGLKLYRSNKFKEAFPILLFHAAKGHPQATSLVAKMYFAGNGIESNDALYRYWLEKAAAAGDKSAKAKSKKFTS